MYRKTGMENRRAKIVGVSFLVLLGVFANFHLARAVDKPDLFPRCKKDSCKQFGNVTAELIETEKVLQQRMAVLGTLTPGDLKKIPSLTPAQSAKIAELANTARSLSEASSSFIKDLTKNGKTSLTGLNKTLVEYLKPESAYSQALIKAGEIQKDLLGLNLGASAVDALSALFKERKPADMKNADLSFSTLSISPMQRVTKFPLLIKEMMASVENRELLDSAAEMAKAIPEELNGRSFLNDLPGWAQNQLTYLNKINPSCDTGLKKLVGSLTDRFKKVSNSLKPAQTNCVPPDTSESRVAAYKEDLKNESEIDPNNHSAGYNKPLLDKGMKAVEEILAQLDKSCKTPKDKIYKLGLLEKKLESMSQIYFSMTTRENMKLGKQLPYSFLSLKEAVTKYRSDLLNSKCLK